MGWIRAAALSEVPEGAAVAVEVAGEKLVLVRAEGEIYALADNCTHRDFPLSMGEVDAAACTVTCEWHGAAFDLRTGEPSCPPATRPVPVFDVRVEDALIFVAPPP